MDLRNRPAMLMFIPVIWQVKAHLLFPCQICHMIHIYIQQILENVVKNLHNLHYSNISLRLSKSVTHHLPLTQMNPIGETHTRQNSTTSLGYGIQIHVGLGLIPQDRNLTTLFPSYTRKAKLTWFVYQKQI